MRLKLHAKHPNFFRNVKFANWTNFGYIDETFPERVFVNDL